MLWNFMLNFAARKYPVMMKIFLTLLVATASLLASAGEPSARVAQYWGGRQAAVSLTFDDGVEENFTLMAPALDRYGLKGTFGINGVYIGDRHDSYAPRMTWDEVRSLDRRGHEINNHTWSHPNLWEHPEMARRELAMNDSAMIAELGHPARSVLFPFNAYTPEVLALCDSLYVGSRLYQFGLGQRDSHATAESIEEWLAGVIAGGEWGISMTHGIHTGWDQWDNPQVLWDFFRTLSERSDTVWTDTFGNVQAYVKERDATVLTVSRPSEDCVEITVECALDPGRFDHPLTLEVSGIPETRSLKITQGAQTLHYTESQEGLLVDVDPHGAPVIVTW